MSNEDVKNTPTTWTDVVKAIAEGGLPQFVAGPAGKAISRLVQGVVDIPAAWLNARAQKINDETDARSVIIKSVAQASANVAMADPQLIDRALVRYVSELHRKQENREAVAKLVVEDLSDNPALQNETGPSDDWMNVFEEHAEKASSDELRQIWSRVLSGEIRKPNSFSLKTLQFLSVLDQPIAEAAEVLLSWSFNESCVVIDNDVQGTAFFQMNLARLVGLIGQIDRDTIFEINMTEMGQAHFTFGDVRIVATGQSGSQVAIACTQLTLIGRELYPVIKPRADEEAIARFVSVLKECSAVQEIRRGVASDDGVTQPVSDLVTVWTRSLD